MTDYSKMTDDQINEAVSKIMGTYQLQDYNPLNVHYSYPNYCESWTHSGPIIQKNEISIMFDSSDELDEYAEWVLAQSYDLEWHDFKNKPLRAAMIVFLMITEANNAPAI